MSVENLEKGTQKGRLARVEALAEHIKQQKQLTLSDVYQYALTHLHVSKRVIDTYLDELILRRSINIVGTMGISDPADIQVVWQEE